MKEVKRTIKSYARMGCFTLKTLEIMSNIKLFEEQQARFIWNEEQQKRYFSIIDIIEVLINSPWSRKYWNVLKTKLQHEGSELSQFLGQLKMPAEDGKMRVTDLINLEKIFLKP